MRSVHPEQHAAQIDHRRSQLRQALSVLVGPGSRLVWEVGSGHGHFLAAFAKAHPASLCIGVDIASDRILRAQRKRDRGNLLNLNFVRAEAEDFLAALPPDARFTSVFVLFPDPWPKRRHQKNRVMKPQFLTAVAARAVEGCALYFRTDHEPYFREVGQLLRAHEDWSEAGGGAWPFEEASVFQQRAAGHFSLVATRRPGTVPP